MSKDERKDSAMTHVKIKRDENTIVRIRSEVDTGADGNTLPLRMYRKMFPSHLTPDGDPDRANVHHTDRKLTAYNGTSIKHYGAISLPCSFKESPWSPATFYIVDSEGPAIIGLQTSLQLNLITMHTRIDSVQQSATINSTEGLVKEYLTRSGIFLVSTTSP